MSISPVRMHDEHKPFYSIIITTYNSASTIVACIKSILMQEYPNFEILVQDGNSGDDTVLLVQQFNDARVRLQIEPDKGIYDAMNKALARSRGSWMLFLGSDDSLYNKEVLQKVHTIIQKKPESRFVYGDVYTSGNFMQRYNNYNYNKLLYLNICHQSIFYHQSLFAQMRYSTQYRIFADWDFNLKVYKRANHPVYTGWPVANFNLSGTSAAWQKDPEYAAYFSDKIAMARRYRDTPFFWYFRIRKLIGRVLSFYRAAK